MSDVLFHCYKIEYLYFHIECHLYFIDVEVCKNGTLFNFTEGVCEPCPLGYYQPAGTVDICFRCDDGFSTDEEGKTITTDCKSEYMIFIETGRLIDVITDNIMILK